MEMVNVPKIRSMTGFASVSGQDDRADWVWEMRAVNGKGLDIRLRLPDWMDGLEPFVRAEIPKKIRRGSVTVSLRVNRSTRNRVGVISETGMTTALDRIRAVEAAARVAGVQLAPTSAAQILTISGVVETPADGDDNMSLQVQIRSQLPRLFDEFNHMRESEGAALRGVLDRQLDEMAELTDRAAEMARTRTARMGETIKENLARIMGAVDADPDRVAQELALLAVKADVTEEVDRLRTHVASARALLEQGGPVGRKLDFLMQEFNREANTLCSKAGAPDLTAIGLDLKHVIDQMREQVQNVE